MRTLLSFLLCCNIIQTLSAVGPVPSAITEVTVYRSGAKITREATVTVPAGPSEVTLDNLSPYFNGNSLQVRIAGDARLNAAVFQLRTPGPEAVDPRIQVLRDSMISINDLFALVRDEDNILNEEARLIRESQSRVATSGTGDKTTLSVSELRELAQFYSQRLLEIRVRQMELKARTRELQKLQNEMNEVLRQLQPNTTNSIGEIVLKLLADRPQTLKITCTYLVRNAAWEPLYDLRSAGFGTPVALMYKANVRNGTGYDWKQVQLHLSSAQPLANNDRPILHPVFIDFRPTTVINEVLLQADASTALNAYQMEQVNIRGSRSKETDYYIDGIRVSGELPPIAAEEDFSALFDVADPQDIPADGKLNVVTIGEQEIPAAYEYHAVPKVESAVFLLAKITDYGQYNLLPGKANIFYEDTYIGQTAVNPNTTADSLLLSLGRDEQITVKRVQPGDFRERRKIFGSRIRETYVYEISIKNNKSTGITVDLLDQIPVSKQKDIEVTLEDRGGAKYDADFGKLEWQIEVPPGKNKKVRFRYSVEYPKDRQVQISKM
ncbi:MAG: mucoidy inhibitor MuiA family protein [Bacteroidetes bacterium]|nr:MAG: mucoidy inhibitor MuiA family protein [Bacteroidota bacterium]